MLASEAPAPAPAPLPSKANSLRKSAPSEHDRPAGPPAPQPPPASASRCATNSTNSRTTCASPAKSSRRSRTRKRNWRDKLSDALKQLDRTKISETELKGQLKQAQDAYQNQLADRSNTASKEMQARISQLETALKNSEAERDAANEQNADIARRVKAQEATEAQLKDQLKQAQDAVAVATGSPDGAQKVLQKRISQLEDSLKNAEAERDAADEQNADAARRAPRPRQPPRRKLKDQLKQAQDALAAAPGNPMTPKGPSDSRLAA